jgi:hypothetical protein
VAATTWTWVQVNAPYGAGLIEDHTVQLTDGTTVAALAE